MKRKIEKFFHLQKDELNFVELFEATLAAIVLVTLWFLPLYLSGGGGI